MLLVKLVPELSDAVPNIKNVLTHIQSTFPNDSQLEYTIVGFGGNHVFKQPHIQTAFGKVAYNKDGALKAVDLLKFDGKEYNEK